jgi:2-keto-4-pentenoate hydratase/2-oxohepta-3-ene-1,7-dioic acid hydratase in catechol pathway
MKIICVGWNYPLHNKEMNRLDTPTEPVIFMKPDSALLKNNKPFFIPDFSEEVDYEAELVVKIDRLGKHIAQKFAPRYYSSVALGIDFTARDLQRKQRAEGNPWEICKAFDNSAAISEFVPLKELGGDVNNLNFRLELNQTVVQQVNTSEMIFNVDEIIEYVSRFFTLKIGDLIFTGTPAGVGKVQSNDHLEGYLEKRKLLNFKVK